MIFSVTYSCHNLSVFNVSSCQIKFFCFKSRHTAYTPRKSHKIIFLPLFHKLFTILKNILN